MVRNTLEKEMTFKLSKRSLSNLEGVDERLVEVVMYAINVTRIDFAVIEGVRTVERQRELVAAGASQTMSSKHIDGNAVDLMAYIGSRGSWELNLYDDIADAMKLGAIEVGVPVLWGAAWNVPDIREWDGTMQDAMDFYVDARRAQKRRPFIDGPHFQLQI
jgi:peptidoglycan L-alanyl-D-glutamate endopeptidase CwlK